MMEHSLYIADILNRCERKIAEAIENIGKIGIRKETVSGKLLEK